MQVGQDCNVQSLNREDNRKAYIEICNYPLKKVHVIVLVGQSCRCYTFKICVDKDIAIFNVLNVISNCLYYFTIKVTSNNYNMHLEFIKKKKIHNQINPKMFTKNYQKKYQRIVFGRSGDLNQRNLLLILPNICSRSKLLMYSHSHTVNRTLLMSQHIFS